MTRLIVGYLLISAAFVAFAYIAVSRRADLLDDWLWFHFRWYKRWCLRRASRGWRIVK